MDILLIRHPQPVVEAGVCYGRADLPLAALPIQQLFDRLSAAPPPTMLWSSPLTRCASLAKPLAQRWDCSLTVDARLQEIDFGQWELKRWEDIGPAALDAWAADLHHARAHGGESVAQLQARAQDWFENHERVALAHPCEYVVTHAGVIRAIASYALGVPLETCLQWPLDMLSVTWLRRDEACQSPAWRLVCWNQ